MLTERIDTIQRMFILRHNVRRWDEEEKLGGIFSINNNNNKVRCTSVAIISFQRIVIVPQFNFAGIVLTFTNLYYFFFRFLLIKMGTSTTITTPM